MQVTTISVNICCVFILWYLLIWNISLYSSRHSEKAKTAVESNRIGVRFLLCYSSAQLGKSFSPSGLHFYLINWDTFAHSALFPKIVHVYKEIPEIINVRAHQKLECALHTYQAWTGCGPRSHSWFMAGMELRPRCQSSQTKQAKLLFPSVQHSRLLDAGTPNGWLMSEDQFLTLTHRCQYSCLCL